MADGECCLRVSRRIVGFAIVKYLQSGLTRLRRRLEAMKGVAVPHTEVKTLAGTCRGARKSYALGDGLVAEARDTLLTSGKTMPSRRGYVL